MKKYISIEELYKLFIVCNQKITTDTRKLENGAIFFALKGENFDANSFAKNAIDGGCAYSIVDNENVANNQTILLVENV
ncbi:MAG TPA: Mur ligase domain-containing protein, partial [Bacteroidia bacterium]|nr:Mur ligase domain-containing protein [Bacteroidia bacterium]